MAEFLFVFFFLALRNFWKLKERNINEVREKSTRAPAPFLANFAHQIHHQPHSDSIEFAFRTNALNQMTHRREIVIVHIRRMCQVPQQELLISSFGVWRNESPVFIVVDFDSSLCVSLTSVSYCLLWWRRQIDFRFRGRDTHSQASIRPKLNRNQIIIIIIVNSAEWFIFSFAHFYSSFRRRFYLRSTIRNHRELDQKEFMRSQNGHARACVCLWWILSWPHRCTLLLLLSACLLFSWKIWILHGSPIGPHLMLIEPRRRESNRRRNAREKKKERCKEENRNRRINTGK